VAGDAALLVPPTDVDALAAALHQAARDEALRARLIARGFERVKGFTWERAARQLLEIYHFLAYNPRTAQPLG
jgi:glycosyltransferase involved in cell wall biosynthesis